GTGLNIANAPILTICNRATTACTFDFTVQADVSSTQVVADVMGYFRALAVPQNGLVFAGAHVTGIGAPLITRFFTKFPGSPTPTVIRLAVGTFEVNFGADLTARFYQLTAGNPASGTPPVSFCDVTPRAGVANALFIQCFDANGVAVDDNFFVQVY